MASRLPNEENDEAMRPMLGWDQAMAALQRNILQQNQQHQTTLHQAAAAAIAAGLTPPTSLANPAISPLWPYNLPGAAGMLPPAAAAAAASLASLSNPANSYLNNLQNLHNPESLLSFQQNLLLLEQMQAHRQLLASNPHLLMAVAAAQNANASISPPQSHHPNNHTNQNHLHQQHHNIMNNPILQLPIINDHRQHHTNSSPKLNTNNNSNTSVSGSSNGSSSSSSNGLGSSNCMNNSSLLTTVNSSLASALTNQQEDSLVDQHFRRSLGDDYNQIISNKADKINVGK